jgi:hypothetical protein
MRTFINRALPIVLDALASVAMVGTIGMLATIVGALGATFGFLYAEQHDFPVPLQYGAAAFCAIVTPVLLGVWLWRRAIKPDDDPPQSKM